MKGRKYPSGWGGTKYRTVDELSRFMRVHPEFFRRFIALCDFCADHGLSLGPGGTWRPLRTQEPKFYANHIRDDQAGYREAVAALRRRGPCCAYPAPDGSMHGWIQRPKTIHRKAPPSWHQGVPLPDQPADTMLDLDRYPCLAVDAIGTALVLRKDGGCFAGDHAAEFGLWWAGKADKPHFQMLDVVGVPRWRSLPQAGRTLLRPAAGWPAKRWPLPIRYDDPFREEDDMQLVRIKNPDGTLADSAVWSVSGSTVDRLDGPSVDWFVWAGAPPIKDIPVDLLKRYVPVDWDRIGKLTRGHFRPA